MNGCEKILSAFESAQSESRAALILYYSLGYPDPATSLEVIRSVAASGADIIELGVPFSDPLADGPTIQHSTQVALEQGMNVSRALDMTGALREGGLLQPLLLMGYYNPILAYGPASFVLDAKAKGADGLIVPDLPPEEAGELERLCRQAGLALVFLLSPASPPERMECVARHTSGFLYLVSLTGVTGARDSLPPDLENFIKAARAHAQTPLAVGFGISTPEQAAAVGRLADGVIVGSALINSVRQAIQEGTSPAQAAARYVSSLYCGLESNSR